MHKCFGLLLIWLMGAGIVESSAQHHYVYFNRERERIAETTFLETRAFEGAQLKYTWRESEPEPDRYEFSMIQHDLEFLTAHGKKLFIQLQDVSFDTSIITAILLSKRVKIIFQPESPCSGATTRISIPKPASRSPYRN